MNSIPLGLSFFQPGGIFLAVCYACIVFFTWYFFVLFLVIFCTSSLSRGIYSLLL